MKNILSSPIEPKILEELRNPSEFQENINDAITDYCQQRYWMRTESHDEYLRQDPYERINLPKPVGGFIS